MQTDIHNATTLPQPAVSQLAKQPLPTPKATPTVGLGVRQQKNPSHTHPHTHEDLPQPAVSQLAKQPLPTLKTTPTVGLGVRQPKNPSPTHPRTHQTNMATIERNKTKRLQQFADAVEAIYPNKQAFTESFNLYQSIKNTMLPAKTELFFRLVAAFTLLNHAQRLAKNDNTFVSMEIDFIYALKMMGGKKVPFKAPGDVCNRLYFKAKQLLYKEFVNRPFTAQKIVLKLNCSFVAAESIINELHRKDEIILISTEGFKGPTYQLVV